MIGIISDIHLDYLSEEEKFKLRELFESLLDELEVFVINGDVFDSPGRDRSVLADILDISEIIKERNTGRIVYVVGNHDIGMTSFLGEVPALNLEIVYPYKILSFAGKRILIEHGHLSDPFYRASIYDLLRIVEEKAGFRVGDILENLVDEIYSVYQKPQQEGFGVPEKFKEIWRRAAFKIAEEKAADVVIYGHTHSYEICTESNTVYLNSGSWFKNYNYCLIKESGIYVYRFDRAKPVLLEAFKFQ